MAVTVLALAVIAGTSRSAAEVVDAAPDGFTVQSVFDSEAPAARLYQALVGSIGSWWHPDHTFSGDPSRMSVEAEPNGCFCERLDAGGVRHMSVVYVEAGKLVRMVGGLGPLQNEAVSGALSWSFEPRGDGARLIVTYKVSGAAATLLDEWASPVDQVLAQAAERLVRFVETGSPDGAGPQER